MAWDDGAKNWQNEIFASIFGEQEDRKPVNPVAKSVDAKVSDKEQSVGLELAVLQRFSNGRIKFHVTRQSAFGLEFGRPRVDSGNIGDFLAPNRIRLCSYVYNPLTWRPNYISYTAGVLYVHGTYEQFIATPCISTIASESDFALIEEAVAAYNKVFAAS